MEIKLHYLPEKPDHSCWVMVFNKGKTGDIVNVANVGYSAKYGQFNCYDFVLADEADECDSYTKSVVAWAYMDEVGKEVLRCSNQSK